MKRMGLAKKTSRSSDTWSSASRKRSARKHFVICVENHEYEVSLEIGKIYETTPDRDAARDQFIRVIDESREDYLFPQEFFLPIKLPHAVQRRLGFAW